MTKIAAPGEFAKGRRPVCPHCKSESIAMESSAGWRAGAWHVDTIYPEGTCGDCEAVFKGPYWLDSPTPAPEWEKVATALRHGAAWDVWRNVARPEWFKARPASDTPPLGFDGAVLGLICCAANMQLVHLKLEN